MSDWNAQQATDDQRLRALDATLTLVTRLGYQATTIAAVAKEAGLSESFIMWHFRNKDRLFAEALEHSYRKRRADAPTWSEVVLPEQRALTLHHNISPNPPPTAGSEYRTFGLMLGLERRPVEPTARLRFIEFRGRTLADITTWWDRCLRIDDTEARRAAAELLAELTISVIDGGFINSVDLDADRRLTTDLTVAGLEAVACRLEGTPSTVHALPADAARVVESLPQRLPSRHDENSTRVQILRATETVAANIGIDAASIARICKESACSPTSIYWFFRDKNAIFEALIGFLYDDWNQTHPRIAAGGGYRWGHNPLLEATAHMLWRYSGAANLIRISLMLFLHSEETHAPTRAECLRVREEIQRERIDYYVSAMPELATADPALLGSIALVHASVCDGLFVSQQISGDDRPMTAYTWVLSEMMSAAIRSQRPTVGGLVDGPST